MKGTGFAAALAAALCFASPAAAGSVGLQEWAEAMADALGAGDGLSRARYREHGERFVAGQVAHYREANSAALESERGRARMAALLGLVEDGARRHVKRVEESVFAAVDPRGSGEVPRGRVVMKLVAIARAADHDGDGRLDPCEQAFAEAFLSGGPPEEECARFRRRW